MDIGRLTGSGGRVDEASAARETKPPDASVRTAAPQAKGDRVDLSTNAQLARRALEELRGMMSGADADPAELRMIQDRLDQHYYQHPRVVNELADRVGGMMGLAGA